MFNPLKGNKPSFSFSVSFPSPASTTKKFTYVPLGLRPPVFLKLSALLSAPPATQNGNFLRVFFDFQARPSHKVATFMKTRGTFSPARQKLI